MFALILWVGYKSTSIVKVEQLSPEEEEGQTTMARYDDGKLYEAKIVRKSDDEHFLSLLTVSTDGEVLTKKSKSNKDIAYSERALLKVKDKLEKQKQEHKKQSNNELLLQEKAIFDDSESSDETESHEASVLKNKDVHLDENGTAAVEQSIIGDENSGVGSGQKRKRKQKHRDSNFEWSVPTSSRKGAGLPSTSRSTKDASDDDSGSKKKRLTAEKKQNQNHNEPATDAASQEERVDGSTADDDDNDNDNLSENEELERELAELKKRELAAIQESEFAWAEEKKKIELAKAGERERRTIELAKEREKNELLLDEERKRRELALYVERRNIELERAKERDNMDMTQYQPYPDSNQNESNQHHDARFSTSSTRPNNNERNINQSRHQNVSQGAEEEEEEDRLKECRTYRPGKVLVNDTFPEIWIKPVELTLLLRWKTKPKEMARRMLKTLVGRKNLKDMCARGHSSKRQPIPEDIVGCIEYYVNKKCPQGLSPAEFTTAANYMIGSIRHPKD